MTDEFQKENRRLRAANSDARALLAGAASKLRAVFQDEAIMEETPMEAATAMELAIETIDEAIVKLKTVTPEGKRSAIPQCGPTRQQGQFLAFISEYMMRNHAGVAPTHADLQRFFNLTAPSVNSMLIRLEQRGFIRRIPGKARAIELTVNPDWIQPLDRPFKFRL
jgi:DNA-binding MarR family transcriptional regulator